MRDINEDFDSNLASNSKNTDEKTTDNRPNSQSTKKLKNVKVNDGISKGRTLTGSKPDKIEINPVIEAADRKSTRLNSSHLKLSRMPSSA